MTFSYNITINAPLPTVKLSWRSKKYRLRFRLKPASQTVHFLIHVYLTFTYLQLLDLATMLLSLFIIVYSRKNQISLIVFQCLYILFIFYLGNCSFCTFIPFRLFSACAEYVFSDILKRVSIMINCYQLITMFLYSHVTIHSILVRKHLNSIIYLSTPTRYVY